LRLRRRDPSPTATTATMSSRCTETTVRTWASGASCGDFEDLRLESPLLRRAPSVLRW
jgi:hypothetical protein